MYGNIEESYIVNFYQVMTMVRLKINVTTMHPTRCSKQRDGGSLAHEISAADTVRSESCFSRKLLGG